MEHAACGCLAIHAQDLRNKAQQRRSLSKSAGFCRGDIPPRAKATPCAALSGQSDNRDVRRDLVVCVAFDLTKMAALSLTPTNASRFSHNRPRTNRSISSPPLPLDSSLRIPAYRPGGSDCVGRDLQHPEGTEPPGTLENPKLDLTDQVSGLGPSPRWAGGPLEL